MAVDLNYSTLDRLLHRLAFAGPSIQLAAADMEQTLLSSVYAGVRGARPIFITSLPRAGTTLMLEALYQFPSLASHLYRDMPFVLAPVIWTRFSGSFRKPAELHERAHGDGMAIGYDSPEAFEEIVWRAFWPEKYHDHAIDLWSGDDGKDEAHAFFSEHMKKIIALRRPDRRDDGRYVSKNNGNVARLDLIGVMFPDAVIVVPVRQPLQHARSLLNQHLRFKEMHAQEPFVRRYMADIGHYEFGSLHRPIQFPELESLTSGRDPLTLDYWLAYWIAGFEYVLARRNKVVLTSYEDCCLRPREALAGLAERLDLRDDAALGRAVALFRDTPSSRGDRVEVDRDLLDRANHVHAAIVSHALGAER